MRGVQHNLSRPLTIILGAARWRKSTVIIQRIYYVMELLKISMIKGIECC